MLSLRQLQFGVPSVDESQIDDVLSGTFSLIDNNLTAADKSKGQFYVFPIIPDIPAVAEIKVAIRLSDLNIKAGIKVNEKIASLDKEYWEGFWQVFNLIQENCNLSVL